MIQRGLIFNKCRMVKSRRGNFTRKVNSGRRCDASASAQTVKEGRGVLRIRKDSQSDDGRKKTAGNH